MTVAKSCGAPAQLAICSFKIDLLHLFPFPMGTAEVSGKRADFGKLIWALPSFWCKMRSGDRDAVLIKNG
jgi:hypothetical protein